MFFAIVARLPYRAAQAVEEVRRLDRWSKRWIPPHITIIAPFEADGVPALIRDIQSWRTHVRCATLGWRCFHNPNKCVIWLDPGQPDLLRARQEFRAQFSQTLNLPHDHEVPIMHITAIDNIPPAEFADIWHKVRYTPVRRIFTIERFDVFQRVTPDEPWTYIRRTSR